MAVTIATIKEVRGIIMSGMMRDLLREYDEMEERIAELEAALYAALHGREVVVLGDERGQLERKVLDDGGIMWRRQCVPPLRLEMDVSGQPGGPWVETLQQKDHEDAIMAKIERAMDDER